MKKEPSVDGYVIAECARISMDPNETPERRRKAAMWLEKLTGSVPFQDGNGGRTVAEAAGIDVPNSAPGGQKVDSPDGLGKSKNENARGDSEHNYYGGPLSSEVTRSYRTGH